MTAQDMRDAAAKWCADEADRCDDAAKWGGHRKYVADCKAAAYALRNAYNKIRALPIPPDPLMDEVVATLEALATAEPRVDISAADFLREFVRPTARVALAKIRG